MAGWRRFAPKPSLGVATIVFLRKTVKVKAYGSSVEEPVDSLENKRHNKNKQTGRENVEIIFDKRKPRRAGAHNSFRRAGQVSSRYSVRQLQLP